MKRISVLAVLLNVEDGSVLMNRREDYIKITRVRGSAMCSLM